MCRTAPNSTVFVYSDETGQQTHGRYLVVAMVAITGYRQAIEAALETIEARSDKKRDDWRSCNPRRLRQYLTAALDVSQLKGCVYYRVLKAIEPRNYHLQVAQTVLDVAHRFEPTKAVFIPEGFPRDARRKLQLAGRNQFASCEVWSSGFKGSATVRLTDALAGLIAQSRFAPGSRKDFPELNYDWFQEVQKKPPVAA